MEGSFSPILRKIAGEVVSKPKRRFIVPTEVCLEDWWLLKPSDGEGIAVSGRPFEIRKCDDAGTKFNIASPKRRHASREFHSTKVVKRHGSTMLETSDGFLISLCGFINKSRTQQNGFTSKFCRDFIYGFPFNWDDYTSTAQSADDELNIESFTPDILDSFNGAQLHDFVLSLTEPERDLFIEKLDNHLTLNLPAEHESDFLSPKLSHTSQHLEQCSTSLLGADYSDSGITDATKKSIQNASTDKTCFSSPTSQDSRRVTRNQSRLKTMK
ncbi:hypothetical protein RND81_01G067300 [Saponaria officinalis]|uniref:SANTA domain-containing protein n=1 Tax=Saponaria officinalis TaxID=3572 RepID=A0AAW1ND02_SAPOF